ncbi:ATP-dependent DNA helicase RecG [Flavisolibacter ginsenosidimutans]|uniref:ATP-dependent DNA helicase RecG n=1 Tax=Flavisolibacter ginsenosidimutans TaxID=661481 RepID=A0A5B8UPA0_9BACT|nr:ATP-dependent DNA helicase RecG [Flavisolibacter ginsenosidimutans]
MSQPIEYLKGVGPLRADLLKKELGLFTYQDLLYLFPYRHIDKTSITKIEDLTTLTEYAQVQGRLWYFENAGGGSAKRLTAYLKDDTGVIELTWFKGMNWVEKMLKQDAVYNAFGKIGFFMDKPQIVHPEIELVTDPKAAVKSYLEPIYPTTEKLRAKGLGGRQISKLTAALFSLLNERELEENLPHYLLQKLKLVSRYEALLNIHFPSSAQAYEQAVRRLKFEELFIAQLRLAIVRIERHRKSKGVVFSKVGELFNAFYQNHLPFQLTGAQKRVLKEIRTDTGSGHQMNRLLQGDVGSGKTIVALLAMLIAIDNGYQCCMMAPTEILSQQHYATISRLAEGLPLQVKLLTGSTPAKNRRVIQKGLTEGLIQIVIGTHALIEETVQFKNLGLAIVDEQHRFGVEQRAKLWKKSSLPPHILVMTATPIPRTLAMTAYGDLDYSIMDELPPGRQPITTVHRFDTARHKVLEFVKSEIDAGRQAYIVFPLIEESAKLDYENLMSGYENIKAFFPEPKYWISMVHGRQPWELKEANMQRFKNKDTQILVGTTVIEVGVDVPNATVMVIESAEKFGLSQLHQLRGRVGRGAEKSYCILITSTELGAEARERMKTMVQTANGFEIAEKDLELRGPGDIEGTRQSGVLNFRIASIVHDKPILDAAKKIAEEMVENDPELTNPENNPLKQYLLSLKGKTPWSKIS